MKFSKYFAIIFLLILVEIVLFSCKGYHSWDKDTFVKLEEQVEEKTPQKKLENVEDFFVWETADEKSFYVKKSWSDEKVQSCHQCHQGVELGEIKGDYFKKAHWNVSLEHAKAPLMECSTCHNQEEVWNFNLGKSTVPVNGAVQLCAQCHSQQKKDWELGAHGKRVTGWQTERAVLSCVACHNPHHPAIEKRWPSIAPKRLVEQK